MTVRVSQDAFELLDSMKTQLGSVTPAVETMLADGTTLDEDADWAGGNNRHHNDEWNTKVRPKFELLPEDLNALNTAIQTTLDHIVIDAGG